MRYFVTVHGRIYKEVGAVAELLMACHADGSKTKYKPEADEIPEIFIMCALHNVIDPQV